MNAGQTQRIGTTLWLLTSGGQWLLFLGVLLSLAGICLLFYRSRLGSLALAILSLCPAVIGVFVIYQAADAYAVMAGMVTPPKPAEVGALIGRAMSFSFCALLATIVSEFFAIAALFRAANAAPRAR